MLSEAFILLSPPLWPAESSHTLQISSLLIVHIPLLGVTWESWTCLEPVGEGQALFYVLAPKLFLMGLEFLWAGAPGLTAGTISQQWPGKMCCRWQGQLSLWGIEGAIRRAVKVVPSLNGSFPPEEISYCPCICWLSFSETQMLFLALKRVLALKLDRIHPIRISLEVEFGKSPVSILCLMGGCQTAWINSVSGGSNGVYNPSALGAALDTLSFLYRAWSAYKMCGGCGCKQGYSSPCKHQPFKRRCQVRFLNWEGQVA